MNQVQHGKTQDQLQDAKQTEVINWLRSSYSGLYHTHKAVQEKLLQKL